MSIVISVIERNKHFYIASDKRGIKEGVVRDDYQKIYPLSKDLYFGMTGVYEVGLEIWNSIKEYDVKNRYSLINKINNFLDSFFRRSKPKKLAIVIAGRDDTGNFLIWLKTVQGEPKLIKGSDRIEFAISANDKIEIFGEYFGRLVRSGLNVKDAIIKTIEYASTIDFSISKEYELYEI